MIKKMAIYTVVEELVRAIGLPINEVFSEINPVPLASGAIAQVHRATLHDGSKVAVKVRHPRTKTSVLVDLSIMSTIVDVVSEISAKFRGKFVDIEAGDNRL